MYLHLTYVQSLSLPLWCIGFDNCFGLGQWPKKHGWVVSLTLTAQLKGLVLSKDQRGYPVSVLFQSI